MASTSVPALRGEGDSLPPWLVSDLSDSVFESLWRTALYAPESAPLPSAGPQAGPTVTSSSSSSASSDVAPGSVPSVARGVIDAGATPRTREEAVAALRALVPLLAEQTSLLHKTGQALAPARWLNPNCNPQRVVAAAESMIPTT
eukprot:TRINITY_DN59705_c0_g1_i1.p1 TRINITY_DN59705_c0_g1~~TRINITY_DN59705_c0_g1_i1.p1  ORF type:complete len:145 (-),score=3.58 TRINITY_DN59705_c0_g1_i1:236-670(-)